MCLAALRMCGTASRRASARDEANPRHPVALDVIHQLGTLFPSALIQSPSCPVYVYDRVLTFAIIAQVWTAGDDHRENGYPAHRSRGRAQLCGDPNPGQGTAVCPNCSDGARRSIRPIRSRLRVAVQKRMSKLPKRPAVKWHGDVRIDSCEACHGLGDSRVTEQTAVC